MAVCFSQTEAISESTVSTRDVLALYAAWRSAAGAERCRSFVEAALARWGSDLMVLDVEDDDYVYTHYGDAIAAASGFDMTGRRVSAFRGALAAFFKRQYDEARTARRPVHSIHRAEHAPNVHSWERLILPCADQGEDARTLLVFNRPYAFRDELLQATIEHSHSGLVAFEAMRGDDDRVYDFRITLVNTAAERFLNVTRAALVDQQYLKVFRNADDEGIFSELAAVADGAPPIDKTHFRDGRWYQISVFRSGAGAAVTFFDVTDLKGANEKLTREIERRMELERRLRHLADHDLLTGLFNRRAFFGRAGDELARADRGGRPFSVAIADIDNFKAVNDGFGHEAGDRVIRRVADVIEASLRTYDVACRLGGEEFAVLLPDTARPDALMIAQRLRSAVAAAATTLEDPKVTISVGVAERRGRESISETMSRADASLYGAKRAGRDRVVCDASADQPAFGRP